MWFWLVSGGEHCFLSKKIKSYIAELQKVQKRATRMIKGLKYLPYEARVKNWGLFSLEKKTAKGRYKRGI